VLKVSLTGSLRAAADGKDTIELEAKTIRELLTRLVDSYPDMQRHLDAGVAVAINGEIYRDNWGAMIPDNAEVFLLPRIQGG
jgi:molybdopterin synthase sulfur carrier subunit